MRLEKSLGLRLWAPNPGPQERAYFSPADVLGYGGAAGGGKSALLLGLAVNEHRRSVILRREQVQGRGMIDYAREVLGDLGRFNENTGVWRGLPGGRQIEFSGVKNPGDEQKHKGRPKDLLAIDEADQFPEHVVRFLTGWLRTSTPGQRCRVVLGFNPPCTAEGRWLLDFFRPWLAYLFPAKFSHPRPASPGEVRWYATLPDGREVERDSGEPFASADELITPRSRAFVPAHVEDNPYLMETGYKSQLQSLPEPLRSQLLAGDFTAGLEDDPWQVIPTAWVQAAMARWAAEPPESEPLSCLGVDVARGGRDKTVVSARRGHWFAPLVKVPGRDTPDGPTAAALVLRHHTDKAAINVDVIGVGGSVYDCLKVRPGMAVNPVNNAQASECRDRSGKFRLVNVRSAGYWKLREALDPNHGDGLALPPDPELQADLTAARWKLTASGIQVEPKEDIIERIGRSPDSGDALVLAHWLASPWEPPTTLGGRGENEGSRESSRGDSRRENPWRRR